MCGIVAITGNSPVAERLIDGLKRLEYRGYDSAGIAVLDDGEVRRRRAEGKIVNLQSTVEASPIDGHIGIAHTRWATHGVPSVENAHPHAAGSVAIVHNGIIENFRELKEELISTGRKFESQTDSEVIAQLIDSMMQTGKTPVEAFAAALDKFEGAFAIAAIFSGEHGQQLLGARRGSPLVLGYGEGEMYLGSDAIALAPLTREVTYLEEGDWVILTSTTVEIRSADGALVNRDKVTSAVDDTLIEKGEYAHFMLKEIYEQPESLARTITPYLNPETGQLKSQPELEALFANADRTISVACGTAYLAGLTAKYLFEDLAGLAIESDIASEFRYRNPVLPVSGPALFVSQSGETADTLAAVKYCKQNGTPTIAVLNVPESSIARESAHVVPTYAGPEIGVASTKAFTAQLAVLTMLVLTAAKARGKLTDDEVGAHVAELMAVPRKVTQALEELPKIKAIGDALVDVRSMLFLGRGRYFPLALEGALKLKEVTYINAEGYAAGELKHGPIALVEDGLPIVVVAPKDELFDKTMSNVEEVKARGARIILISDAAGIEAAGNRADDVIEMPAGDKLTSPILAAVPLQLLAYYAALAKGTDVDQPRNLAKSVTVE